MTEVATGDIPLNWDVFVTPSIPAVTSDLPISARWAISRITDSPAEFDRQWWPGSVENGPEGISSAPRPSRQDFGPYPGRGASP
jgi:hypothetical protein